LTQQLFSLLGLPSADFANYDPATKELTFRVDWNHTFVVPPVPLDFSLDLGDFANIETTSTLELAANVDLGMTLGLDLTPNQPIAVAPPVFQPVLPDGDVQPAGVLSADASFDVVVFDQLDSGDQQVASFSVVVAPDLANATVDDLVADVQTAVDTALSGIATLKAGDIVVEFTGARIALTAKPTTTMVTDSAGNQVPKSVGRRLEISTPYDNPALLELGLLSSPTPFSGVLTADINFALVVDGTSYPVVVAAANTITNSNVDDLVDDINRAINLAMTGNANTAAGVQATRVTPGGNRLAFMTTAAAGIATLGLVGSSDPADGASIHLGIDPNFQTTERAHATEFFVEDAVLAGDLSFAAAGVNASATLGFLGVDVTGSSGSITGAASFQLKDPSIGASRVTLATLLSELGNGTILYDDGAGTGVVDATITGNVAVDLTIAPQLGPITAGPETLSLDLVIDNWILNPPVLDDVTDSDAIQITLSGSGTSVFDQFRNIEFTDIVQGLSSVVETLRQLDGSAGGTAVATVLDTEMPLVNRSLADLLSMADRFATLVEGIQANPAQSVQALEILIKEQLGLAPDSTLVGLSLDTVDSLPVLRVDLRMEAGLQDSMPLDVDLAGLAALATGNPFPANFSNLIGVSSTGVLDMELGGSLDLALGFELDTTPTPFLYTGSGGTKLSLSAGAAGQDLDFTAQVGPFGIFVIGGSADLTGGIDVTLADAGGVRLDFGPLSAGDIAVDISGDASARLPLYFPDESSPIGG
ncbi:MAG: hypothetical protein ACC645_23960, partial [Pirellulales bacterium]